MAYPCCDVTKTLLMRLKINPRWRTVHVTISPKVKQIQKLCKRLLYIIFRVSSNDAIKILVAVSL